MPLYAFTTDALPDGQYGIFAYHVAICERIQLRSWEVLVWMILHHRDRLN